MEDRTAPIRRWSVFAPSVLAVLMFVLCFISVPSAWAGRAVIPPGQEQLLSDNLFPPAGILPAGVDVDGISVREATLRLLFKQGKQEFEAELIHTAQGSKEGCLDAPPLKLCPHGTPPPGFDAYGAWLKTSGAAMRAGAAWSVEAEPEKHAAQKDSKPERTENASPLVLLFFALMLVLALARSPQAVGTDNLTTVLLFALFLFLSLLLHLAAPEGKAYWLAFILSLAFGLLAFRLAAKGRWDFRRDMLRRVMDSGLIGTGIGIALLFAFFLAYPWLFEQHEDWITFLHSPLIDNALRATLIQAAIGFLFALSAWAVWRCLKGEGRRAFFWGLALSAGLVAALFPLWCIRHDFEVLNPGSVWPSFKALLFLAHNAMPDTKNYLGFHVLGSVFVRLFGETWLALAVFRAAVLLFFAASVSLASYLIWRDLRAALGAALLVALHPQMTNLGLECSWILAAAGTCLLALSALIIAARKADARFLLLGILLFQIAFEIRIEALVLVPLYFLIEWLHDVPNRRWGGLVGLLFGFNFLRLILILTNQVDAGRFFDNLAGYQRLLADIAFLPLLAALALRLSPVWALKEKLILASAFGGFFLFYLVIDTRPTFFEVALITAPLFPLAGGLFVPEHGKTLWVKPLAALVLALALIGVSGEQARNNASVAQEHTKVLGESVRAMLDRAPEDAIILLDPAYLSFSRPQSIMIPLEDGMPNVTRLLEMIGCRPAVCLNDQEREDLCCYMELNLEEKNDKYTKGNCWDSAILNREVRVLASEGKLRLLSLTCKENPAP